MKTIFNILVILVAAVLVGGLFYGAVTVTSSGTNQPAFQERPAGDNFPRDREEPAGGVQVPVEMIKNLIIIAVVAVGYLNITKYFGRKKIIMHANA